MNAGRSCLPVSSCFQPYLHYTLTFTFAIFPLWPILILTKTGNSTSCDCLMRVTGLTGRCLLMSVAGPSATLSSHVGTAQSIIAAWYSYEPGRELRGAREALADIELVLDSEGRTAGCVESPPGIATTRRRS